MNMQAELVYVKLGLAMVLAGLLFGIGLGVSFDKAGDSYNDYIISGLTAHPELHDDKSKGIIWRYSRRAHFHATGIAAFSLGLILLIMASSLKKRLKSLAAFLIGLGSFYPLSWFTLFMLAPGMGRSAAHGHILTKLFTYIGVGGLMAGLFVLLANLFFGLFRD
jgi:MFS family permease